MSKHQTRKDRRKEKTGAKAVDHQCRNNGPCPECMDNRTRKNKKREESATAGMKLINAISPVLYACTNQKCLTLQTSNNQDGYPLLFCCNCSGPVEVVSDELPF